MIIPPSITLKYYQLLKKSQGITMRRNVELDSKLDSVESYHGYLLRSFKYWLNYYVSIMEL